MIKYANEKSPCKAVKMTDTLGVIRDGGVYRVAEIVTPQGHYITWPTAHSTAQSAYAEIVAFKARQRAERGEYL
jgi:hypothetical protein